MIRPAALEALPLGSVRPAGWLLEQLRVQAAGLSGHLHEFWPSLVGSGWLGGDGEGWERGPYWLDGVIPLAVLTSDEELLGVAGDWVSAILDRQQADGWLGPGVDARDPWPQFIAMKALLQWHEFTSDDRILDALLRCASALASELRRRPLRDWAHFRAGDAMWSLLQLHGRVGEQYLLDLAALCDAQAFDWPTHLAALPHRTRTTTSGGCLPTHGVNIAMGLKHAAARWCLGGDDELRDAAESAWQLLQRFHGQPSGMFSCDEHLAGRHPSQGVESCAVVEAMHSMTVLTRAWGGSTWAPWLERIAFNALPACWSPDMWTHQYDQQANQIYCGVVEDPIYTDNGPDANMFGLEPHFGCCTANLHQGWPKFAAHQWMRNVSADALTLVTLAPSEVHATLTTGEVHARVRTNYPFSGDVTIAADVSGAETTLHVRRPEPAVDDAFLVLRLPTGRSETTLRFPLDVVAEPRDCGEVCLTRGPLVLVVAPGEKWQQPRDAAPYDDREVVPTGDWRLGVVLDDDGHPRVAFSAGTVAGSPFATGEGLAGTVAVRSVGDWPIEHGAAGRPPRPAVARGPVHWARLVPYGCARIRIAQLPVVAAAS